MTPDAPSSYFSRGERTAGLLLHVASLPGPYGIGDFGPIARLWIDRLSAASQSWWQTLPLVPNGKRNSPYESVSTFAGNPLLISPDDLCAEGLLAKSDLVAARLPAGRINYDAVNACKTGLVSIAWERFRGLPGLRPAFEEFCHAQTGWLEDYALFDVLKQRQGTADFTQWPAELRYREPSAIAGARSNLAADVDRIRFEQFLVARQFIRMKAYAHSRNVRLIGDLPFFVGRESADVWANPQLFLLDSQNNPEYVAGVPPDYFSENGQLWGNPVYDWDVHRRDGYRWWLSRLKSVLAAFAAAWHVPADAVSAKVGQWRPGPGSEFFETARAAFGVLPFIAEDLGLITPDVRALRDQFDLPGMAVLQFAFDGKPENPFLPANYVPHLVAYTGTHDNDTTRGWYDSLSPDAQRVVWRMLDRSPEAPGDVAWEMLRLAWSSRAMLAIAPWQDILNLGSEDRMNVPGRPDGNWTWRTTEDLSPGPHWDRLREVTNRSGRGSQRG